MTKTNLILWAILLASVLSNGVYTINTVYSIKAQIDCAKANDVYITSCKWHMIADSKMLQPPVVAE